MKSNTVEIQYQIEPVASEWERLAQHTKASPFLWPGWISSWLHAYGKGCLKIYLAYQSGRLAGVLPLYQSRGVLSSTTNSETPLFGFLVANEMAAEQLSHALFSQKAHRIDLSFLDPTDVGVSLTRAATNATNYQLISDSIQGLPYVNIDGTTWNLYESGLRSKFRSELRRRRRRLEEEGRLKLEVFDGTDRLDELLEEGFRLEGSGWKDTQGTSINARPATRLFYTEVAQWSAKRDWLRLAFLRLNGRALAFDYCLEYNKTHYLLKTGYDPAYKKFAPGMIIRYLMLTRAFSEKLATYDFLGASDAWKQEWTSTQRELQFLHMFAPTTLGFLDQAVFMGRRSASERLRNLIRSSILPEHGSRLLKQGHVMWRRRLDRRGTS